MQLDKATRKKLGHMDIDPTWGILAEEGGRKVTADMQRLAKKVNHKVVHVNGLGRVPIAQKARLYKCVRNDGGYWVTCFEHPDIEMCRKMLKLNPEWRKAW